MHVSLLNKLFIAIVSAGKCPGSLTMTATLMSDCAIHESKTSIGPFTLRLFKAQLATEP